MKNRTYVHGGYREFIITDSKKRTINAAPFRDRVVHHMICNIIEPILDRTFIYDSYACRKGKGTHRAFKKLEKNLRSIKAKIPERERELNCKIYVLKCDISKFFDNIDHNILIGLLKEKIGDKDTMWLIEKIIRSHERKEGVGIPIGNLTSQLFANVYLNKLDHYIKRVLKERYYIRYMDDFIILGTDKRKLFSVKEKIRDFLNIELKLTLHPKKSEIFPADNGIDFLGYVLKNNKRFLRKSTVKRFLKRRKKARLEESAGMIASFTGYAKFADSWELRKRLKFFAGLSNTPKNDIIAITASRKHK